MLNVRIVITGISAYIDEATIVISFIANSFPYHEVWRMQSTDEVEELVGKHSTELLLDYIQDNGELVNLVSLYSEMIH